MSYLESDFPAVVNATGFDVKMYNRIVNAITDMVAAMSAISDNNGNISLEDGKAIEWGSTPKLTWSAPNVQVGSLEILDTPYTVSALSPTGDCDVTNDADITGGALTLSGNLTIAGVIEVATAENTATTIAQIAEPGDPPDEHSVIWCSNGTGIGDVGDIILKIQHGSVVKSSTLVNFV